MLKDRRALIESEIIKAKTKAADMYFNIVVSGNDSSNIEYETLKKVISELEFQLNMIDALINKGHK